MTVVVSAASQSLVLQVWDMQEEVVQRGQEEAEQVSGSEEPT